jgi:hypothetical protein
MAPILENIAEFKFNLNKFKIQKGINLEFLKKIFTSIFL